MQYFLCLGTGLALAVLTTLVALWYIRYIVGFLFAFVLGFVAWPAECYMTGYFLDAALNFRHSNRGVVELSYMFGLQVLLVQAIFLGGLGVEVFRLTLYQQLALICGCACDETAQGTMRNVCLSKTEVLRRKAQIVGCINALRGCMCGDTAALSAQRTLGADLRRGLGRELGVGRRPGLDITVAHALYLLERGNKLPRHLLCNAVGPCLAEKVICTSPGENEPFELAARRAIKDGTCLLMDREMLIVGNSFQMQPWRADRPIEVLAGERLILALSPMAATAYAVCGTPVLIHRGLRVHAGGAMELRRLADGGGDWQVNAGGAWCGKLVAQGNCMCTTFSPAWKDRTF